MTTHKTEFISCDYEKCNQTLTRDLRRDDAAIATGGWVHHRFAVQVSGSIMPLGKIDLCPDHASSRPREVIHSASDMKEMRAFGALAVSFTSLKLLMRYFVKSETETGGTRSEVREALKNILSMERYDKSDLEDLLGHAFESEP